MAYFVLGNQKEHGYLRHLIVGYINRNFSKYINFVVKEEQDTYRLRMYKTGEYGGYIEILAFTEIFGCTVEVYRQDHPDENPLVVGMASDKTLPVIFSGETDSGHYNVLRPLSTPNKDIASHKDYISRLRDKACREHDNNIKNFKILDKIR